MQFSLLYTDRSENHLSRVLTKNYSTSTRVPLNLGSGVTSRSPGTHGYPGGGGVICSKDLGQCVLTHTKQILIVTFCNKTTLQGLEEGFRRTERRKYG